MANGGNIIIGLEIDDRGFHRVTRQAGDSLSSFKTRVDQSAASLKKLEERSGSASTKFRHLVMTLGNLRFVAMDINDVFLRLPVSILKSAGDLERMQVLMTGLSKETNKAAREAEGLKNYSFVTNLAKTAPFDIAALSDSFVKLKTAGLDPADGSMNALVDSVARFGGTSESLKRASIAIQQMSGKGVVSMEELRQQLGEAVPTAMQDMADGMGVSMAELAKIVQTGTLAAGPAIGRMLVMMQVNNAGAAAELMKTWSGTLSRLKTEWELAAKFIADNGFGNSAKDAVLQITELLRSDTFQRFASNAGAVLSQVTQSLISIASTAMRFSDTIVTLTKAWIAYKVVFSGIVPLSDAIRGKYAAITGTIGTHIGALNRKTAAERVAANAELKLVAQAAAANDALAAKEVTRHRARYAAAVAANTALLAEQARASALMTAMANAPAGQYSGWASRNEKMLAASQQAAVLQRQIDANVAAQGRFAASLAAAGAAQRQAQTADAARIATLTGLATATSRASAATVIATGAARVFGGVMALMGGPIGVAITAIMALVYWYDSAASKAEESAARQRRANEGLSSVEDAKADKKALAEAEDSLKAYALAKKRSDEQLVPDGFGRARKKTAEEKEASPAAANLKKAQDVVNAAIATAAKSEGVVRDASMKSRTDQIARDIAKVTQAVRDETAAKVNEERIAGEERLKSVKKDSKEYTKVKKEMNDRRVALHEEGAVREIAAHTAAANKLRQAALKNADKATRSSNLAAAEFQEAEAQRLQEQIDGNNKRLADPVTFKEKADKNGAGGGKAKKSAYQKFVEELAIDKAKLQAAINGIASESGRADAVLVAMEETRQKIKDGTYKVVTGKGKSAKSRDLTDTEAEDLVKAAGERAEAELVMKDMEKMSNYMLKLKPDWDYAVEVMKNPLGVGPQKRTNQFDEFLTTLDLNPEALLEFSRKLGVSADEYVRRTKEARDRVNDIDRAPLVQKTAEDTQALYEQNRTDGANLIQDERTRAAELLRIADEFARAKDAIRLASLKGQGVDTSALEVQMLQAASIRAQVMAEQAKSPMQKLTDEWKNSMSEMDQAGAQWANGFVDMLVSSSATGKLEFRALAVSVLSDIAKVQLKTTLADPMNSAVSAGTNWLKKTLSGPGGDGDTAAGAASEAAREIKRFASGASNATLGLQDMTQNGTAAAVKGIVANTAATATETTVATTFTGALGLASSSVYGFIAALEASTASSGGGAAAGILGTLLSVGLDSFAPGTAAAAVGNMGAVDYSLGSSMGSGLGLTVPKFADGGIMTNLGPVPLRKYAAGGIARSPQLALYGEAGAEAFVPLPDGRSIPVTMKGGGNTVTIQINVQRGGDTSNEKGDESGAWSQLAQRVKSVVREELINNQRPGGILYK